MVRIHKTHYVVFYSVSTSNHNSICLWMPLYSVVSYSVSTSNHNYQYWIPLNFMVVSYSVSTSNHNFASVAQYERELYLILFLHQTTTCCVGTLALARCILFCFYIKPQLLEYHAEVVCSCILFCFYIKPQQYVMLVVSHCCCILFCFYIKPQHRRF